MTKNGFLFFYDWLMPFEILSGEEFKSMFVAMLKFQRDGTPPPEFEGASKIVASFIFPQLERRKAKSEAGKAGMESRWKNQPDAENAENTPVSHSDICGENEESAENAENDDDFALSSVNNKSITLRQDKDKDIDSDTDVDSDSDKDKESAVSLSFIDGEYAIANDMIKKYAEKYPYVDVPSELEKMSRWLSRNVKNRVDAPKFINGWLCGENRRGYLNPSEREPEMPDLIERSHDVEEFFRIAVKHTMGDAAYV